jgi:hypothetical protein
MKFTNLRSISSKFEYEIKLITMEELLQGNKNINHPITTPIPGDEQKKYKITSKDQSIHWRVEVQLRTKRDNIFLFCKKKIKKIFLTKSTYTRKLSNPSFSNGSHINSI